MKNHKDCFAYGADVNREGTKTPNKSLFKYDQKKVACRWLRRYDTSRKVADLSSDETIELLQFT
jgi:hypothetical protein